MNSKDGGGGFMGCDIIIGGLKNVAVCDREGRGSVLLQNSVT